jgi:pimeloyl-ACP methyl ester carboxylesterase
MKRITILFYLFSFFLNAQNINDFYYNVSNGNSSMGNYAPGSIIYPTGYSNYSSDTPVIFVHGFMGKVSNAYEANIDQVKNFHLKAAFVQLKRLGSTVENGQLLKRMIDRVRSHFNVSTVSIVAHSRGGMDTERALYGQNPYVNYSLPSFGYEGVDGVYTLSSPLRGARVADLGATLSLFSGVTWVTMWYTNGWSMTSGSVNSFHNWARSWRINSTSTFFNYYNPNGAAYSRINMSEDNTTRWWAHQSNDECYQGVWYFCYIGRPFHHTVGAYMDAYWEWDWFNSGWRNWHSDSDGLISEYRAKRNVISNASPSLTPGAGDANYRTMHDANHTSLWDPGENHFTREVGYYLHNGLFNSPYGKKSNEIRDDKNKLSVKAEKSSIMASNGNIYFAKNGESEFIIEENNSEMEVLIYAQNAIDQITLVKGNNTFNIDAINSFEDKFSSAKVSVVNFNNLSKGIYKLQTEEDTFLVLANNNSSNTAFAVNLNFDEEVGYDGQSIEVGIANKDDKIDFSKVKVKAYLSKIAESHDSYIELDKITMKEFLFNPTSKKGIYKLAFTDLTPGNTYSLRIEALSKEGDVLLARNIVNTFYVKQDISVKNVTAKAFVDEKSEILPSEIQIEVYPNPMKDKLTVQTNGVTINKIQWIGLRGEMIKEFDIDNATKYQFNIDELHIEKGMYFLNIITSKGEKLQKVMVN